eukprot:scaffold2565_cov384-Prasinococcus_capsulatus_cf.AAC.9
MARPRARGRPERRSNTARTRSPPLGGAVRGARLAHRTTASTFQEGGTPSASTGRRTMGAGHGPRLLADADDDVDARSRRALGCCAFAGGRGVQHCIV